MPKPNRRHFLKTTAASLAAEAVTYAQTPKAEIRILPIEFGRNKMVFCDWEFVDAGYGLAFTAAQQRANHERSVFMPRGVRLRTGRPKLTEQPVIVPNTPTDGVSMGAYCTLMKDGGKYRLWYESYLPQQGADEEAQICYAESDDGFTWKKPKLGIISYNGSDANNLVYRHGHGATVFIDPSASSSERYKLIHLDKVPLQVVNGRQSNSFLFGAVSPDGIHWKRLTDPVIKHTSDTQSVMSYDASTGKYVAYLRGWEPQTRAGYGGRRILVRTESAQFGNFPEPVPVLALGPQDPPDADIYTSAYQAWPGAMRAHLMIPAIYHRSSDHVDLRLATSRNGVRWNFTQGEPFVADGEPGSGFEGTVYAGQGTVPLGDGMWAFPVARYHRTHNMAFTPTAAKPRQGGISLAMLREDGYITLDAEDEGECWTQPSTFDGVQLKINCWGETGARVLVELTGENGTPLPGYALEDCDGLTGDQLWAAMRWRGNADISSLRGKLIRVRFVLRRVRLHAFRFE